MKNAIERRIDRLGELWNEFAENPQARLLRWLVDGDAVRMIDLFVEVQNEEGGDIPDLFFRFDQPFEEPHRHGLALRESLLREYEQIRQQIAEDDIPSDWICPPVQPEESDVAALVRSCASFRRYYEGLMVHLVGVLVPEEISSPDAWQSWLQGLVGVASPPNVRFMVVDDAAAPALNDLSRAEPKRVVSVQPELDMPGAYAELLRGLPGSGPGFTFRRLFVALANASAAGNLVAAQQAADAALKIASGQSWPQMQVAVFAALGAAHLAAGKTAEALRSYRGANQAVAGQNDPTAAKLNVQTRFAEASVLLSDGEYEQAAEVYEQTAPLAEQQEDHLSALEGWRMAAYCRETAGQPEEAWKHGQKALDVGALLDEQTRANSTLPYAGQGLLRLTRRPQYERQADAIRQRMVDLVGPGWEENLAQEAPSP